MHENYDLDLLLELVEQRKFRSMKELLSQMNEVDIAEFLDELDVEQEILVFRLLPKDTAAEVFTYLENTEDQEKLIGALSDRELREVLDELYLDDTVDIIEDMPANVVSRILRNTDASTRSQINQLLNYPKDSAGSIMTTEFVFLHPDATVEEYGEPYVDGNTGEQVAVKNVLVLYTDVSQLSGDSAGRLKVRTTGSGGGLLVRDGLAWPITWEREGESDRLSFYREDGQPAALGVGHSYINIVKTGTEVTWAAKSPEEAG